MELKFEHNGECWVAEVNPKTVKAELTIEVYSPKEMPVTKDYIQNINNFLSDIAKVVHYIFSKLKNSKNNLELTCQLIPDEYGEIIQIIVENTGLYPEAFNYYKGRFIAEDEVEELAEELFIEQDGIVFNNIKFVKTSNACNEAGIKEFENKAKLKLPESYRDFLLNVNGGVPIIPNLETDEVPYFASLRHTNINLFEWNFDGDLTEHVKRGLVTIADAGQGFGGHTSIYCKEGEHYGKIFCWYWDDHFDTEAELDDPANKSFLKEHFYRESFEELLEKLGK